MPTKLESQRSDESTQPHRLELSLVQVLASASAAVTATVAASYLGVAGTVVGAAVASVLTVVGNAIYLTSLHRTRDRVLGLVPAQLARRQLPWRRLPWRPVVLGTVALFVLIGGVVTVVEAAAGRPLTDIVRNQPGSGTSFLGDQSGGGASPPAGPSPTSIRTTSPAPASTAVTSPSSAATAPSSPARSTATTSTAPSAPASSAPPTSVGATP
jgi:hypothetical protein